MKIRLYLEITTACNLKCQYCFEQGYHTHILGADKILKFLDIIFPIIDDVVITGGEPSLHPDFVDLVKYISSKVPLVITTNGCAIKTEKVKELLDYSPNIRFQFSFDAINSQFVDAMRGKGVFDTVYNIINSLENYNNQLSISSTLTKQTPEMIEDIYNFAKRKKINCYFPSLLPYGALVTNWQQLMPALDDYLLAEEKIIDLIAKDDDNIIHSNKVDIVISNYWKNNGIQESADDYFVIKLDAQGNLVCCPATDYGYECSRVTNIYNINSLDQFYDLMQNCSKCSSAHLMDYKCVYCEASQYCDMTFCGNCIHMNINNKEILNYLCETYKAQYIGLIKAFED